MKSFAAQFLLALLCFAAAACSSLKDLRELPPTTITGTTYYSHDALRDAISAEVGDAIQKEWTRSAVDDGAFAIERAYANEGYAFTHVEWTLEPDANGKGHALFKVEEGPRVTLESLDFEGAVSLKHETLESFFPRLRRLSDDDDPTKYRRRGPPWWIESQLESATRDLEDYYYKNGYLEARVQSPRTTLSDDRKHARVVISVYEGVRSMLTKLEIEGAPEHTLSALKKAAAPFQGKPYSPLVAGAVRSRLEEELAVQGYPDAKATHGTPEHGEKGETTITFTINAGPRVRIASIDIRGAKRTRKSTILDMVKLEPGDYYNSEKERESFRALYQSGLFTAVHVYLAAGDEEERVWIIDVTEGTSIEFYVEPGYGSYERFRVGLGGRYKNLFGTGRSLEIDTTVAELAQSGRVSLITPRVFGTDIRSTVSVFTNRREEPSFTSRETGLGWNLARRLTRRLSATLGYQFRRTSVSDVQIIGPPVQALIDAVEISSIALTPVYDTRDSVFVPTQGSITKVTFEIADGAIGSELDFIRLRMAYSKYFPLWAESVLAASWRGGLISPIDNSDAIPLQERFFNGGENTVRSFREDQLGPTDIAGNPVGGEVYHVFSVELRQNLTGNLDCGVFVDIGNVQLEHTDFFDTTGFRGGYGFGLRYVLPIGPIRLDYGINPDPRQGEASYVLHFTVGMAF